MEITSGLPDDSRDRPGWCGERDLNRPAVQILLTPPIEDSASVNPDNRIQLLVRVLTESHSTDDKEYPETAGGDQERRLPLSAVVFLGLFLLWG